MQRDLLSKPAADAVSGAQQRAEAAGHSLIEPEHLLAMLFDSQNGRCRSLLLAAGGNVVEIEREMERLLALQPRSSGRVTALPSPALERALEQAAREAHADGAGPIGPDHLLLGLATQGISERTSLLQRAGVTVGALRPLVRADRQGEPAMVSRFSVGRARTARGGEHRRWESGPL
jgi:ATP-dependent Clp protease ATP-binding subunit ClpA